MKKKCLVILGPSATGKTDLGLELAKKFNGEIVSCDSRQIYQGFDLASGKAPNTFQKIEKREGVWVVDGINIWMYDLLSVSESFNASQFASKANTVIGGILNRNKLPIIVGGTGLYLKLLLEGFSENFSEPDPSLRQELEGLTLFDLQEKIKQVSLQKWEQMNDSDKKNKRRLVRAIEIFSSTQKNASSWKGMAGNFEILKVGLIAPMDYLTARVNKRVDKRFDLGMVDEWKKEVEESGVTLERLKELGLEFKLIAEFAEGKITSELRLREEMRIKIRQFVKRQITWFKKEKDACWFDISDANFRSQVEKIVQEWYYFR